MLDFMKDVGGRFDGNGVPKGRRVYRPVYVRWWFWVAVFMLIIAAWQTKIYFDWKADNDSAAWNIQNQISYQYWQYLERQSAELEEAWRSDQYGGETPEETLQLFVEALEARDFELAAKYFVPEEQDAALEENKAGEQGGNQFFVDAYRNGRIVPPDGVGSSGIYEIEVFPPGEDVAFAVRLIENEFTGKWKILEL
jgi:hypothetical protein